jgi:hypothetical protein
MDCGDDPVNHRLDVQRRGALGLGWSVQLPDVETGGAIFTAVASFAYNHGTLRT